MGEELRTENRQERQADIEAEQRFARAVGLEASQRWLPETRRHIGRLLLESDDLRANLVRAVADRDRALESLAAVKALTVCQAAKIDRLQRQVNEQLATIARLSDPGESVDDDCDPPADGGCPTELQRQLDEQLGRSERVSGPGREMNGPREFDT